MEKIFKKKKKKNLLEDLKKSLLNFSFAMIYAIHKMLVLVKYYLNHLKENVLE